MTRRMTWLILPALLILILFIGASLSSGAGTFNVYLPVCQTDEPDGWQWHSVGEISLQPAPAGLVTVVDDQGRLHLIWDTLQAPHFLYHSYEAGSGWSAPQVISQSLGISTLLAPPVTGSGGSLDLAWHNDLGPSLLSQRILYAHFDGQEWQPAEELYRIPGSLGGRIEAWVQHLQQGDLTVVVRDDGFTPRAFQLRRDGGSWASSGAIEPGHPVTVLWPDQSGGIYFYGSSAPARVVYSYWRDGVFQQQAIEGEGTLLTRTPQPDPQNNLHLFWLASVPVVGDSVTGLYSQCLAPGLQWQPPQVLSGGDRVWTLPVTAAGQHALSGAAWEQEEADAIHLQLWRGCAPGSGTTVPGLSSSTWDVRSVALHESAGRLCLVAHRLAGGTRHRVLCATLPGE